MKNILVTGVGGQGTVLASKILAQCAVNRGEAAHTAETIGMAQRGGTVIGHVRLGDAVHSPLITHGTVDLMIAFEPSEAVRCLPYLAADSAIVVSTRAVQPSVGAPYDVTVMLDFLRLRLGIPRAISSVEQRTNFVGGDALLTEVDADALFELCGSYRPLNVALLGAAARAGYLEFSADELIAAMRQLLPERLLELNVSALEFGLRPEVVA